ncbi:MAG: hypothetical protein IPP77_07385 [Bacteroidetes bacterium]|nr:hypothetical protein [Bacteroidota bacterium]
MSEIHPAVRTVFFHELGHFIARELNLEHFKVMGTTKEINIYPSSHSWREYDGETVPLIPVGEDPNKPIVSIAEQLAVLPYGCLMEAIFIKKEFKTCFAHNDSGGKDVNDWSGLKDKTKDSKALNQIVEEHFTYLSENKIFSEILNLDVGSFLVQTVERRYSVDLDKLKKAIKPFLNKHEELYLSFVRRIRDLLPE